MENDKLESKINQRFLGGSGRNVLCRREEKRWVNEFRCFLWKSKKKKFSFGRIKGKVVRYVP